MKTISKLLCELENSQNLFKIEFENDKVKCYFKEINEKDTKIITKQEYDEITQEIIGQTCDKKSWIIIEYKNK